MACLVPFTVPELVSYEEVQGSENKKVAPLNGNYKGDNG